MPLVLATTIRSNFLQDKTVCDGKVTEPTIKSKTHQIQYSSCVASQFSNLVHTGVSP